MIQEPGRAFSRNVPWRDDAAAEPRPRVHGFDPRAPRQFAPLPAELAALERAGVAPGPLHAALAEAERSGVSAYDALATSGAFDESDLIEALSRGLGVDVCGVEDHAGPAIDAETFSHAMRDGHLQTFGGDDGPRLLVRASGDGIGELAAFRRGQFRDRAVALATPREFASVVCGRAGATLASRAAEGPVSVCPKLTVARGMPSIGPKTRAACALAFAALGAGTIFIDAVAAALLMLASAVFAALNGFRLWLTVTPPTDGGKPAEIEDRDLPVYSVMIALLREGAIVPSLLDALDRLDYPRAKLDIKILVEEKDSDTRAALDRRKPRAGIEVIVLAPGAPQTKPRALNAGLLAARGEFVTVFDAEDRPEPKQLRHAVAAFRNGPPWLGCLQARLAIDNLRDNWLTRQFAIEYAALFDVVLPALSTLGLPIPLGGTSNHFRVDALRRVGGWNAGNVTEDADLGLRLARLGWKTQTLNSVTWEEAPTTAIALLKQRTRWMKGFMVTSIVHGRGLRRMSRRSAFAYVASQILIGGVALTALAYPLMISKFIWDGVAGGLFAPADGFGEAAVVGLHVFNLILGFTAAFVCALLGVRRRCPRRLSFELALTPLYWLIVGAAAWRAAFQIVQSQTTHWEKTVHGVSRRRATPA